MKSTRLWYINSSVSSTLLMILKMIESRSTITYKALTAMDNLIAGLARVKNNVAPGIDGEVKQQITEKRLQKLYEELASQKYQPKPSRRVAIPKPDGGVRYLGIASNIDKVVQGALLEVLEPVLEKSFSEHSHGFRPGKGCHSALKEIKYGWKAVTWIINVDIQKCFDRINHDILLEKLKEFCDQSTIELIRKLLKVGYVDVHNLSDRSEYSTIGTPQGSLISPILCNLYLHSLDEYIVKELLPNNNVGKARRKEPTYSKRYSLDEQDKVIVGKYPELKKALARAKHNRFATGGKYSASVTDDSSYRRMFYIRYADDFLIGFTGPRKEAQSIYDSISDFLKNLKLDVNHEKSKIYHSGERGITYLGMYLRYYKHNQIKWREDGSAEDGPTRQLPALQAQAINNVQFRAPIDRMLNRLVERGLAKKRKDGTARGTAYLKWGMLEDAQIVQRYSAIIRGLMNYYSCINKRSELWKVLAVVRKSCALTIAHKHGLSSAARAYARYGPNLTIRDNTGKERASLFYPKSLKTKIDFKTRKDSVQYPSILDLEVDLLPGSTKSNIKTGQVCEYEGCGATENLEAHHTNPIANLDKRRDLTTFEKALIRRKRKVVMLCKKHHSLLHKKRVFEDKKDSKTELKTGS